MRWGFGVRASFRAAMICAGLEACAGDDDPSRTRDAAASSGDAALQDAAARDGAMADPSDAGMDAATDGSDGGSQDSDGGARSDAAAVSDAGDADAAPTPVETLSIAIAYQAQCRDCDAGDVVYPPRSLEVMQGDPFIAAKCRITRDWYDSLEAFFSLEAIDPVLSKDRFFFAASWALSMNSGSASDCWIRYQENTRGYSGHCGMPSPSSCELTFDVAGSSISGSVRCPSPAATVGVPYYLAAPMSTEPATFEIRGCAVPDLSKLNAPGTGGGQLTWARHGDAYGTQAVRGLAVASDGAAWIAAFATSSVNLGSDEAGQPVAFMPDGGFLARYTSSGALSWGTPLFTRTESFGNHVHAVAAARDGSAIVTGEFMGTATFGEDEPAEVTLSSPSNTDLYVARYRPDGSLIWVKRSTSSEPTHPTDVATHSDGSFAIVGTYFAAMTLGSGEETQTVLPKLSNEDLFIARFEGDGALRWAVPIVGPEIDRAAKIAIGPAGETYVAGDFNGSITLGLGTPEQTMLVGAAADEQPGFFVARYDADASLAWVKPVLGARAESVAVLSDGSVVLGGRVAARAIFGEGEPNETTLPSGPAGSNAYGAFVARYSAAGTLSWARYIGASCCLAGTNFVVSGVAASGDGIVVAGEFAGYVTLGAGERNETTLFDEGAGDFPGRGAMFVARYTADGALQWARSARTGQTVPSLAVQADGSPMVAGRHGQGTLGIDEMDETGLFPLGIYLARFRP